jgi:hypothetical protein
MLAIKIYATGTSSTDSIASFIVPVSGRIVLVTGTINLAGTVLPTVNFQIASQSTSQWALNDTRNIIAEANLSADSTSQIASANIGIPIPGVAVKAGDKIYVHRLVSGTVSSAICNFNLWII